MSLQQAVLNEVERLRKEEQPPVLNEEDFAVLARSDPKNDILDPEELQLGKSGLSYILDLVFDLTVVNLVYSGVCL